MKMDAMQKRRTWKVAIAHFFLTLIIAVELGSPLVGANSFERRIWLNGLGGFWLKFLWALQPHLFLLGIIKGLLKIKSHVVLGILGCILIPIWSFCFGWLYVKFTNWLNHFPVLGKKVF
jgi:hypothetical protein